MTVRIATDLLDRILAEAAASPHEICGLLVGTPDEIRAARSCRNVAADPRLRFEIDPAALIGAHRAAREGGPALIGCYHSHPNGELAPSLSDAADAAADGTLWLIVAGGKVSLFRAAPSGELHGRFDVVPFTKAASSPRP